MMKGARRRAQGYLGCEIWDVRYGMWDVRFRIVDLRSRSQESESRIQEKTIKIEFLSNTGY